MQIQLSHPARTIEIKGPKRAKDVLKELNLVVEAHLVIRGDDLVTEDEMLADKDHVEIRPVISGGSIELQAPGQRHADRDHRSCFPASHLSQLAPCLKPTDIR